MRLPEGRELRDTLGSVSYTHLVGTSGGAWAAVNAALERPDLMDRVAADSFDGRRLSLIHI